MTDSSSATLDPVTTTTPPAPAAARTTYATLWRGVPRELGFLVLTMPIAIVGLSVLQTMFWFGVGTIVIYR